MNRLNIGYGITLIGDIPSEIKYTTTRWETDERIDAVEKNTFPEQFMLITDIVGIHEEGAVTNPLDCTMFSEVENVTVTVVLPSVDDFDHIHLKYKAGVRFRKCWEFFDIEVLVSNTDHLTLFILVKYYCIYANRNMIERPM